MRRLFGLIIFYLSAMNFARNSGAIFADKLNSSQQQRGKLVFSLRLLIESILICFETFSSVASELQFNKAMIDT